VPDHHLNRALDKLETRSSEMIRDLARLVAVDTSFPPGSGYGQWADLLEEMLVPLGFVCERVEVPEALWQSPGAAGARINLIARRGNLGNPISIYFHSDTAPVGEGWTRPAHRLSVEDDILYGRGTADMKGTIAAVLGALRAMDEAGAEFAFDPVLLFCTDEEGGKYPGVRYLAETGRIEGHLLCMNGQALPRIWAGCFGSIDLRVCFKGRAAHSGDGINGINAIEEAVPILAALKDLKGEVEGRTWPMPAPPSNGGRPLNSKLTITAVKGGAKGSALPALFEIIVNRRYAPEEDVEAVIAEIEQTIETAVATTRLLDWDTQVVGHLAPVDDPVGEEHWPRWIRSLSRGFGWPQDDFKAWGATSSSDMGWVQKTGISEILLGGLSRPDRNVHAADEHTTEADLIGLARSVTHYLSTTNT
jgi:succinyl-diaminopimelate desuccinylase